MTDADIGLWGMVLLLWFFDLCGVIWILAHLHRHSIQYGPLVKGREE